MTTGSVREVYDESTASTYYVNVAANGGPIFWGHPKTGRYIWKDWNGVDDPPHRDTLISREIRYTTVDRNGKVVKRKYVLRPLKRSKHRAPHNYHVNNATIYPGRIQDFQGTDPAWGPISYLNATFLTVFGDGFRIPAPPAWTANDDLVLISKLREKTRGSEFNPAVFFAEGYQALGMITDAATRLARAGAKLKKGDLVGARNALIAGKPWSNQPWKPPRQGKTLTPAEAHANNWLSLQYGWMPLLGDMKSGAELLAHRCSLPYREKVTVKRRLSAWGVGEKPPSDANWGVARSYVQKQLIAYYTMQESSVSLSGVLDPELVAWELTPFSFVADWVAPIGDYLANRAFASRLEGLFVTTSTWCMEQQFPSPNGGDYFKMSYAPSSFGRKDYTVNRVVTTVLDVPAPVVKDFGRIASWKHCANAVALLVQTFSGRKSRVI